MERIGVEDRIFVNVLGSLILFIFAYFSTQFIAASISCCRFSRRVDKCYKAIKVPTPMRSVITIVYLETYIDFLIGGLVNAENRYTFNDSRNWGPNGYLTYSD